VQGFQGDQGLRGEIGLQGAQGNQGDQGNQGVQGPAGPPVDATEALLVFSTGLPFPVSLVHSATLIGPVVIVNSQADFIGQGSNFVTETPVTSPNFLVDTSGLPVFSWSSPTAKTLTAISVTLSDPSLPPVLGLVSATVRIAAYIENAPLSTVFAPSALAVDLLVEPITSEVLQGQTFVPVPVAANQRVIIVAFVSAVDSAGGVVTNTLTASGISVGLTYV